METVVVGPAQALTFCVRHWDEVKSLPRSADACRVLECAIACLRARQRAAGMLARFGYVVSDEELLEFVVGKRGSRRRVANSKVRFWGTTLPKDALIALSPEIYLCAPEFCFVLLARDTDIYQLRELASELCGTYFAAKNESGFINLNDPLTSAARLSLFVECCCGADRIKLARRAAAYTIPHAHSPMETALAQVLSLPKRCGGYGLVAPVLNQKVEFSAAAKRIGKADVCYPDLLWPKARLVMEYLGDAYHKSRGKDEARRLALEHDGYQVHHISAQHIYDIQLRDELARIVANANNKRLWPATVNFRTQQQKLIFALKPRRSYPEGEWIRPFWALDLKLMLS